MDENKSVFRKKTLDRISSPEQLTDYLKVTNPGVWIVLIIVVLLLGSLLAWSFVGRLETTAPVKVVVENHNAEVISIEGTEMTEGMTLRVSDQDAVIVSAKTDDYGRSIGVAEVMMPDGTYDGNVVTETIRPLDFLLESR